MPDTQVAQSGITRDAPVYRVALTDAAVERAKDKFGVYTIDELCARLGFERQTFWRLRRGTYDIRISKAIAVAAAIDWPLHRTFHSTSHPGASYREMYVDAA